jgi:hypothetical protein
MTYSPLFGDIGMKHRRGEIGFGSERWISIRHINVHRESALGILAVGRLCIRPIAMRTYPGHYDFPKGHVPLRDVDVVIRVWICQCILHLSSQEDNQSNRLPQAALNLLVS